MLTAAGGVGGASTGAVGDDAVVILDTEARAAGGVARRLSSEPETRRTGTPIAAPSMANVPAGAPSSRRWLMVVSELGIDRVGSDATNPGRRVAGAASAICRCSGDRNAQPAGGGGGGTASRTG